MSSEQIDDAIDQRNRRTLANHLGVSLSELENLDWDLDESNGDDGMTYGYILTFHVRDDEQGAALVARLTDGRGWLRIGPLDFER